MADLDQLARGKGTRREELVSSPERSVFFFFVSFLSCAGGMSNFGARDPMFVFGIETTEAATAVEALLLSNFIILVQDRVYILALASASIIYRRSEFSFPQ